MCPVTLVEGTMKVYGLPEGQGLDRRNAGEGNIIPAVQVLARGQSIVPSAKVSIAFSALNSCSVITR